VPVSTPLFAAGQDWLAHTLANASCPVEPGTCALADGTRISRKALGVLEVSPPPERSNPNNEALIVSAGVHGNETAPVELLNQLVSELLNGDWPLACPLLLILGNPPAMVAGTRFIDANMNRLFRGAHKRPEYRELPEAERARNLEALCREFARRHPRLALSHYDLHTAIRPSRREKFALYPFVAGRQVPPDQCAFLLEAQVETLVLQHREGTTFSSFSSSELHAESFTLELGKVRPFGQNDPVRFAGIRNALRRRFKGEAAPATGGAGTLTLFEVVHEIINTGGDFRFLVPDDAPNFTEYSPGTLIWEDGSDSYRVGDRPEAIVFPNRHVPEGQRVGLMIRPRQLPET